MASTAMEMMGPSIYKNITECRSCGSEDLADVLDLGVTPLADRLLTREMLNEIEPTVPLTVVVCRQCALVQIRETVEPEILFGADYPYYSSVSPALMSHFQRTAETVLSRRQLTEDSLVLELASNDGYLLKHYQSRGIPVLGIDPAPGPAARAIEQGIDTRVAFFTCELAEQLQADGVQADVIHANNVLAHVADTNGFVAGIEKLLKPDGEAVIECPYVVDLVESCEFDTIYHQHLCYFSVSSLDALFRSHGLFLNHLERTTIHGGSLRLFVGKREDVDGSVTELLEQERATGVDTVGYYGEFGARVSELRQSLRELLDRLRQEGNSIVGYGAAAKACTLTSYIGIDRGDIDYIADMSSFKQGRYYPGNHLPIVPPEQLLADAPDYVLILAWNFADEIIRQQHDYAARGGRFIVPIPEPHVRVPGA